MVIGEKKGTEARRLSFNTTRNLCILTLTLKAFSASISKRPQGPRTYISLTCRPRRPYHGLDGKWLIILLGMRAINLTSNTSRLRKCIGRGVVL